MKLLNFFRKLFSSTNGPNFSDTAPEPPKKNHADKSLEWEKLKTKIEGKNLKPAKKPISNLSSARIVSQNITSGRVKDRLDGRPKPSQMSFSPKKSSHSKYPVFTLQMIDSGGKAITTAQAITLFKDFTLKVGYLDKKEVSDHAGYFADEIKSQTEFLAAEVSHTRESFSEIIVETRNEISALKRQLAKSKTEIESTQISINLINAESELQEYLEKTARVKEELAAFKADKRAFLVAYINRQTQSNGPIELLP